MRRSQPAQTRGDFDFLRLVDEENFVSVLIELLQCNVNICIWVFSSLDKKHDGGIACNFSLLGELGVKPCAGGPIVTGTHRGCLACPGSLNAHRSHFRFCWRKCGLRSGFDLRSCCNIIW